MGTEHTPQIMCVARTSFPKRLVTGMDASTTPYLQAIGSSFFFANRDLAENDPDWKQIIPFAIVQHKERFLRYRRGKAGSEARLHNKLSIGFGGHIDDSDLRNVAADYASDIVERALIRELKEEIGLVFPKVTDPIAVVNEELTPVGRVHLGLVFIIPVQQDDVEAICPSIVEPQWLTIDELWAEKTEHEFWSQLCMEQLNDL